MVDKKVISILRKSWRNGITDAERKICIEGGAIYEQEALSHDELIQKIKEAASEISIEKAMSGFWYSISTGDYRYRTALSSLIWAKQLPEHTCVKYSEYRDTFCCAVCEAVISQETGKTCLDMLKHGRHRLLPQRNCMDTCCAGYVLNDLKLFAELPEVKYCEEDFRIVNRIFGLAQEISPGNKVNALLKLITAEKTLEITAADAYSVLGVLAACGVFDTPEQKGYASGFVNCIDREFVHDADIYYPINFWKGRYGIHFDAIEKFFGKEIADKVNEKTIISGEVVRDEEKKKPVTNKGAEYFVEGEHCIELDDEKRYYYGLAPLDEKWDKETMFAVHRMERQRLEIYYEGNQIKKVIMEQNYESSDCRTYMECDMEASTRDRKYLLPKTSRGREKTLTITHLLNSPYMVQQFNVILGKNKDTGWLSIHCLNNKNHLYLPLPEKSFTTKEEFEQYTREYIDSCPDDYDDVIKEYRNKERISVKYKPGDIFRVQISPDLYTYALIVGRVRWLEKWEEIAKNHPLRHMMWQPLFFRQYAIVTKNGNMTAEELEQIPLLDTQLTQDNEVAWGIYPIVCCKKLKEADIDLYFGADSAFKTVAWGLTFHKFEEGELEIFNHVEKYESQEGKGLHETKCYTKEGAFMAYGGSLYIHVDRNNHEAGDILRKESHKDRLKRAIAEQFGFSEETACDEFAEMFGGLTRKQYIELVEKRLKR